MGNCLTVENAESLLDKTLTGVDENGRRFPCHYYPLTVKRRENGRYYYTDRNHVDVLIDTGDEISYGESLDPERRDTGKQMTLF